MARELITRQIDEHKYDVSQFGASQSWKMLVRLSKIMGGPMSELLAKYDPKKKVSDQDLGDFLPAAVKSLLSNLDENSSLSTVKELCASCMVDGVRLEPIFDVHFQGKLGHLMKVLGFILEAQYGDFLGAMQGVVALQRIPDTTKASPT